MIFLVRYFIGTALLVLIYILYAQKWAEGFTEPSRYGCVHMLIQLCKYIHAVGSGDQFFYPSNRNLRFRCEMR